MGIACLKWSGIENMFIMLFMNYCYLYLPKFVSFFLNYNKVDMLKMCYFVDYTYSIILFSLTIFMKPSITFCPSIIYYNCSSHSKSNNNVFFNSYLCSPPPPSNFILPYGLTFEFQLKILLHKSLETSQPRDK